MDPLIEVTIRMSAKQAKAVLSVLHQTPGLHLLGQQGIRKIEAALTRAYSKAALTNAPPPPRR